MNKKEEQAKREQTLSFLIELFKEEITLLQEIFSYVKQKEYSLLTGDQQIEPEMEKRKANLQEKREGIKEKREKKLQELTTSSLEKTLDVTRELDLELLILHQKWEILHDKTESQELRNEELKELLSKKGKMEWMDEAASKRFIHFGQTSGKRPLITIDYPDKEREEL